MKLRTILILVLLAAVTSHAKSMELMRRTWPGITADKSTKQITIKAWATGLGDKENAEFLLINEKSGHDYEAIAMTSAKPSDVHKALEFIGMTPGKPNNPGELQFWPRGERVIVKISSDGKPPAPNPVRAEKLVIDSNNDNKHLPETGFVFTGSMTYTNDKNEVIYAADTQGPISIISHYNEVCSVLDVPRQASKGAVYGSQLAAAKYIFTKKQPLTITLEPEYKDGKKRQVDFKLITGVMDRKENGPFRPSFSLVDNEGKSFKDNQPLDEILKSFIDITGGGQSPFITWEIKDHVPLSILKETAVVLASIESDNGIRMNPPPNDHLYYQAFLPNEKYRERENRIAQPWELKLSHENGVTKGILTHIEQIWKDGVMRPELKLTHYEVDTPEKLKKIITEYDQNQKKRNKRASIPVILIFTKPTLTHGQLMKFITPARETHGIIHVFLDE